MKSIYKIVLSTSAKGLLLATLLLSSTGCEKYFDVQSPSEFTSDYTSSNDAYMALIGVYNGMTAGNTWSKRLSMYYTIDTDEFCVSGNIDDGRRGLGRYNLYPSNVELVGPWRDLYHSIERANLLIEGIQKMDAFNHGSEEEKAQLRRMLGEGLTLRALYYLELVKNWGDVPFKTTPTKAGDNMYLGKTDRDVIYEHLINDLLEAENYLPMPAQIVDERVSKTAAQGLLARIALYRGGYSLRKEGGMRRGADHLKYYQIARDKCKAIIESGQHSLTADYKEYFRSVSADRGRHPSRETIFEISFGGSGFGATSGEIGSYMGTRINGASKYGKAAAGVLTVPTYYYQFDPADERREVAISMYEITANNQKNIRNLMEMYPGKWRRYWKVPLQPGTNQFTDINWVLIRYADILLMFAEAENELNGGPTGDAIAAFEQVRSRGFRKNPDSMGETPTDYEGFFNAIVKERSLELGGEGLRKFDLIRWNMFAAKIAETRAQLADLSAKAGQWTSIPDYVWFKRTEDIDAEPVWVDAPDMVDPNLKFPITFTKPTDWVTNGDGGWFRAEWGRRVTAARVGTFVAPYFEPNKNELYPIHADVINANYNLTNDYGY